MEAKKFVIDKISADSIYNHNEGAMDDVNASRRNGYELEHAVAYVYMIIPRERWVELMLR